MKLLNLSKIKFLATNTCRNTIYGLLNSKPYTTQSIQPKKSFLIKKTEPKVNTDIPTKSFLKSISNTSGNKTKNENSEINPKFSNKKVEYLKTNLTEDKLNISIPKDTSVEKVKIKENYACVYYKFPIEKNFDLFNLRNLLYAYIFVRQRKGNIYLNFSDSTFKGETDLKNKKVEETLKLLDWLDISLDFDDKFKTTMFESQRQNVYSKWLKYLLGQKDAYRCFCKNYKKCEKNCCESRENIDGDSDYKNNSEIMYIRFRNQNKVYKYYDYMTYEDKEFDSTSQGDFLLYKNFNNQYLDSFKRVIDDDIYSVTHIIEEKRNFNPFKNAILTKHLMFGEKKYIELPNINIKYWNKEDYDKLDIDYLRSRSIVPEALLNEALMLGYTKNPAKEFKELLMRNKDKDVADWTRVIWQFDITNTYARSSEFDIRRLLYLNKRNMIKKFIKSHESYKPQIFEEFKQTFITIFKIHENKISEWDYETWRKIIYMVTPNILSYEDIYTYYFLFESPIVSAITKDNKKAIKAFILDEDYKQHILKEVLKLFSKMEKYDAKSINREISYFIFKRYQKDRNLSNINFYPFLKLIVTGYADAPNLGEICEFIGKTEVLKRIKNANKITKNTAMENIKLLQDKKQSSINLLTSLETKLISDK